MYVLKKVKNKTIIGLKLGYALLSFKTGYLVKNKTIIGLKY